MTMIDVSAVASEGGMSHSCRPGECKYTTMRARSFIYAYRDALRYGDDPAEYIRDSIKPSRRTCPPCHKPDPIEPNIRSEGRTSNRYWYIEIKVAMEEARTAGIALDPWNADRLAAWLCGRDREGPR